MSTKILFLAISQAHQFLHWLPAALRLAREPGTSVTVASASPAALDFLRSYDPRGSLELKRLNYPFAPARDLFHPAPRVPTLLLNVAALGAYPTIVTSETTSGLLRRVPGFAPRLVLIKHGAGDREGSYNRKHRLFDLILVNGDKHRDGLIARGLVSPDRCIVTGNAKLELLRPSPPIFADGKPLALYNPHFDPALSTWHRYGPATLDTMARIPEWNFIVAPHVKTRGGPDAPPAAPNLVIDRGSARSIDMSYTQAADVYIGDVSSQVYEFIVRPRPCIFLNLAGIAWEDDPTYAHWRLGQVIESVGELGPALARAAELQPRFAAAQQRMLARSIDHSQLPASERQARAILDFARAR